MVAETFFFFFQATTLQYLVGFGMCVALDSYRQILTRGGCSDGMFCTADGVYAIQGISGNEIDHYNYIRVDFYRLSWYHASLIESIV